MQNGKSLVLEPQTEPLRQFAEPANPLSGINGVADTDLTLNQYIIQCRIKNAVILLREGNTEYETVERCGFGDTSGLIRSFKFFTV